LEKRRMIELIGALFVAVIFLTSYAAFAGGGARAYGNATTTARVRTYYVTGRAQANITSYGQVLEANVSCKNATSVESLMNGLLAAMERNGSVSNFYSPSQGHILVQLANYTAYKVYGLLSAGIGPSAACTNFTTQANAQLPARITFSLPASKSGFAIAIPSSQRSFTLPIALGSVTNSIINVSVATLVTENGTIYGSISVIRV
jgi:hypothetical protein